MIAAHDGAEQQQFRGRGQEDYHEGIMNPGPRCITLVAMLLAMLSEDVPSIGRVINGDAV